MEHNGLGAKRSYFLRIKRTKMKTAKQLINEYINKGSNMPIEGMELLTKFECELLMEQYAQEVVKNNFVLAPVSGSLPCNHNYIQKDTYWKSCTHCGMIAPLGQ